MKTRVFASFMILVGTLVSNYTGTAKVLANRRAVWSPRTLTKDPPALNRSSSAVISSDNNRRRKIRSTNDSSGFSSWFPLDESLKISKSSIIPTKRSLGTTNEAEHVLNDQDGSFLWHKTVLGRNAHSIPVARANGSVSESTLKDNHGRQDYVNSGEHTLTARQFSFNNSQYSDRSEYSDNETPQGSQILDGRSNPSLQPCSLRPRGKDVHTTCTIPQTRTPYFPVSPLPYPAPQPVYPPYQQPPYVAPPVAVVYPEPQPTYPLPTFLPASVRERQPNVISTGVQHQMVTKHGMYYPPLPPHQVSIPQAPQYFPELQPSYLLPPMIQPPGLLPVNLPLPTFLPASVQERSPIFVPNGVSQGFLQHPPYFQPQYLPYVEPIPPINNPLILHQPPVYNIQTKFTEQVQPVGSYPPPAVSDMRSTPPVNPVAQNRRDCGSQFSSSIFRFNPIHTQGVSTGGGCSLNTEERNAYFVHEPSFQQMVEIEHLDANTGHAFPPSIDYYYEPPQEYVGGFSDYTAYYPPYHIPPSQYVTENLRSSFDQFAYEPPNCDSCDQPNLSLEFQQPPLQTWYSDSSFQSFRNEDSSSCPTHRCQSSTDYFPPMYSDSFPSYMRRRMPGFPPKQNYQRVKGNVNLPLSPMEFYHQPKENWFYTDQGIAGETDISDEYAIHLYPYYGSKEQVGKNTRKLGNPYKQMLGR